MTNRGGTARPLTYDELALKFSDNAGRRLPAAAVQDVRDLVGRLDELPELGPLWSRLAEGLQ
jgi:hypothetical protein